MIAKDKAKELVDAYFRIVSESNPLEEDWVNLVTTKQCALICVDEILNDDWYIATLEDLIKRKKYYQEVKQEINQL